MLYMLDTNVLSHVMQGRDTALLLRLTQLPLAQVCMSSVTLAELQYGIHRRDNPQELRAALEQVLQRVTVLPWDETTANCYGETCSSLEKKGINLSDFDMMIAAHAIAVDCTLVSRDKAFRALGKVLKLEVW